MSAPARRRRAVVALTATVIALSLLDAGGVPATADDGSAAAARALPTTTQVNARIARKVPARLTARPLGHRVSVGVSDASAGSALVFARRANRPMLPASNMKLVTAVTAMRTLGLDTRIPTDVVAQGAAGRKVVLVAGGDPVLTSAQLAQLARRASARLVAELPPAPAPEPVTPTPAVRALRYKVSFDDSLFASPTLAPGWPGGYVPGVVRPVRALVRDGRGLSDTSTDAGRYFADKLRARLDKTLDQRPDLDVAVRFRGRAQAAPDAAPVAHIEGNTVRAAVSWMLLVSDNDIAEMLYRLSAVYSDRPGTWAGGRDAAAAALASIGVPTGKLVLADGSGVSRSDRLTARALVRLLQKAADPGNADLTELRSLLPVSGISGTLRSAYGRYTTAPSRCARGKISAKTGTLHDTVALSGYTQGRDGRAKVFSVLVNNRPERSFTPLATRRAVDTIAATVNGCA